VDKGYEADRNALHIAVNIRMIVFTSLRVEQMGAGNNPTALQLHDLAGQMLLYFAKNNELPPSLAEVPTAAGVSSAVPVTSDPVTGQHFAYLRAGIEDKAHGGRVLVFEGPRDNIKVTVAEDLVLVEAALRFRQSGSDA